MKNSNAKKMKYRQKEKTHFLESTLSAVNNPNFENTNNFERNTFLVMLKTSNKIEEKLHNINVKKQNIA